MSRNLFRDTAECLARLAGRGDPLMPPRRLIENIGGGDFNETGREFMGYFIELAQLKPSDRVLDIGCGCGRMAVPLARYLTTGSYRGFDIDPKGVAWCAKVITPRYPLFRFEQADVFNEVYNPRGKHLASQYRFPYADATFDFVCLTSVFTHMLWADMVNYLSEIGRVLKPGGRCLITFFLLDAAAPAVGAANAKPSDLTFPFAAEHCQLAREDKPEWAVAFKQETIESLFAEKNLRINFPIRFGKWSGRPGGLSYQDMILATKQA